MSVHQLRPFCALEHAMRSLIADATLGRLVVVRIIVGRSNGQLEEIVIQRDSVERHEL